MTVQLIHSHQKQHKQERDFVSFFCLIFCRTLVVFSAISSISMVSSAWFTLAEPLAAAFRIVEQNVIQPHHKVAVIGDGKLGLLIAEVRVGDTLFKRNEIFSSIFQSKITIDNSNETILLENRILG